VLLHGEHVAQNLRGVGVVGEPVPHRDTGVTRELLDDLLAEATYSMPSYMRPSTRAVSFIDSLWPIWDPDGPR